VTKVLVTGGAGFIGHHVIEHFLKNTDWEIVSLDRLSHSGTYERLKDMKIWEKEKHRVKTIWHDLRSPIHEILRKEIGEINYIFHMAASTHVDRSIEDPMDFVMDNTVGTTNILLFAHSLTQKEGMFYKSPLLKFFYFDTDEVFGPASEGINYKEWDRFNASNPYAAAKAGANQMCVAFANTYKLPIIITHTMNIFGERQHFEKFIPSTIRKVVLGETVTIHSNKEGTKAGSRFYLHARNVGAALLFLVEKGECLDGSGTKGKYNIVGEKEVDNLELAQFISEVVGGALHYEMVDFHSSRPGHDLRYALDGSLLKNLGFDYPKTFEDSLKKTIKWYLEKENMNWLGL